MSASISVSGYIKSSGVTVENEPIILSDGVGAVTQWDNSTQGAGEGIYFVEGGSAGDPLRLGIGVAAPTASLHVLAGDGSAPTDANTHVVIEDSDHAYLGIFGGTSGDVGIHFGDTAIDARIKYENDNRALKFAAGGTADQLIIDANGNVAIGQSSTANFGKLQVYATGDQTEETTAAFTIGDNATGGMRIYGGVNNANNYAYIGAVESGTAYRALTLQPNGGYVGVDKTAPQQKLHVSGGGIQIDGNIATPASGQEGLLLDHYNDGSRFWSRGTATARGSFSFIHLENDGGGQQTALTIDSSGDTTLAGKLKLDDASVAGWIQSNGSVRIDIDNDDSSTDRAFVVSRDNGSATLFSVNELGAVSTSGTLTVGSLDIGHGLGGDVNSVAIGNDALDATTAHCLHNTAVGNNALSGLNSNASSNDAGDFNTSVGSNSSSSMTTGHSNTAVGRNALGTDDGVRNVSIGMGSLDANCADDNAALGYNALAAFTGSNATAVGSGAADAATSADNLTAVGQGALGACTDGNYNTAVGTGALASTTTNDDCAALGSGAGNRMTGSRSVLLGSDAGYFATSASDTIAIGAQAFRGDGTTAPDGDYNIAIGSYTLDASTTATRNISIGYKAGTAITSNHDSVAIGHQALEDANGGENYNVAIGSYALNSEKGGADGCVAVGYYALKTQDGGARNLAIGYEAASALTDATDAVFIGYHAGGAATQTGSYNIGIGNYTIEAATSGYANLAIGHGAGRDIVAGYHNTLIGFNTGVEIEGGDKNVAVGSYALASEDEGVESVAIGYNALFGQNAAVQNTGVGTNVLFHNKSGDGSTALGYAAGFANVDGYNTWIGHGSGRYTGHAAANTALGYRSYKSSSFENGTCDLNGSTTVTCDSNTDIQVGQAVTGSGIPRGAYVTAVNDSTGVTSFTLSIAATTTANNQTLTFYRGTGDSNTCIGYTAGEDITTGAENVCIGRDAGKNFTNNNYNVAIGAYAMDAANAGEGLNVAIGWNALGSETSGADYCVAIGGYALINQNSDVKNTAIGGLAGDAITTGDKNTFVGYAAGSADCGDQNTAIGDRAFTAGTGASNTCVGHFCGSGSMTANDNTLMGVSAGAALTSGPANVLIGRLAGSAMTSGSYNIAIGYQAADAMTGGSHYNIAVGDNALGSEASGADSCIAIGSSALAAQNDASSINLAIGTQAGDAVTSGKQNVFIGHTAGSAITSNDDCTAVGYQALNAATGGSNTAIGTSALAGACTGANNVAIGASALGTAALGCSDNIAIGNAALYHLNHNSGDYNIAIGNNAGRYYETTATTTPGSATADGNVVSGHNSIFIGYDTRSAESDRSNEIVIGHTAVSNGSNTITLGNDDTAAIHCADTSIAALSDRRIKRDIKDTNVGLSFIDKLTAVEYKRLNPADWPEEIRSHRYRVEEQQELVTPAVEAAEAVYKDVVVVEARAAVEEVTETIEHPAKEAVYEDVIIPAVEELKEEQVTQRAREEVTEERVVQEAREEITEERIVQEAREEVKGERHKHTETEVTETVTREEIVQIDGKWVKREVSEEVTRTERTPVYEECDLYNEDGTQCMCCVTEARDAVTEERQVVDENGDGVVGEDGNPVMETVEIEPAVEAVHEPMKHKVPVMEEYVIQEAQEEKRETVVVQEAREEKRETVVVQEAQEEVREMVVVRKAEPERTERRLVSPAVPARTEVRVITPAEPAVEEVKERRLVSPAVEAQEAVYKTVTVPADERPDDDDTVRLGLVAQDVQTAMTEAGVEFDLVTTGANGKLAVKYSNLVIPLLKAVQELSAEVKALKG